MFRMYTHCCCRFLVALFSIKLHCWPMKMPPYWNIIQGSRFKFEFGSTCATRCKVLGAQLKILGNNDGSIYFKRKSEKLISATFILSSPVCYLYFSPVVDKTQPICYAVIILLRFLILISLFDGTVVTKENLHLKKKNQNWQQWICRTIMKIKL